MWNKIFFAALAIAVLAMASLGFYSNSWLQSTTRPTDVIQNYEYYSNLAWMFLWISAMVLLVLANALYWRIQQSWALWATFLYFAIFVIVQTFLLDSAYSTFQQRNFPAQTGFSAQPLLGAVLCVVGAIIVFFDQFIVSRLHKKMYGVAPEEVQMPSEESL